MKFGGTSVASLSKMRNVTSKIQKEVENGNQVILVVSAMAGTTDELIGKVTQISPLYDAREYDVIVSSGENVSAGLIALLLQSMGVNARSWQGWQIPMKTTDDHSNARIQPLDELDDYGLRNRIQYYKNNNDTNDSSIIQQQLEQ